MKDVMDLHTHTIVSGHAYNTLYEMVHSAADKGVELLGVTEHAPKMPGSCNQLYYINLKVVPRELFGVRLMLGAELNILDYEGRVDLTPRYLDRLDFAIASIHDPCYENGTIAQNTQAYLEVMKNPAVQIIGHPDDSRFPVDYETLVCAARENHVLLELNNSSLHPLSSRAGARENYLAMLEYCKKYKACVVIDSDAHCEVDVANHAAIHKLLEEISFPEELVVNTSLKKAAAYLPRLQNLLNTGGSHD